jgi:hypothetical protein
MKDNNLKRREKLFHNPYSSLYGFTNTLFNNKKIGEKIGIEQVMK